MKTSVNTNDFATYKSCCIAQQPHQCTDQFVPFSKSVEWCIGNHCLSPRCISAIGIGKQVTVLVCYKKTGSYCIYTNASAIPFGGFNTHPPRIIIDGCLCH